MAVDIADWGELLGRRRAATDEAPVPVEVLLDRDIDPDPRPSGVTVPGVDVTLLERAIGRAARGLLAAQRPSGEWCFELESNVQIEAQWVFTLHYLGLAEREAGRLACLRRRLEAAQGPDGGWPLFCGGEADLSVTVQAYFAAKLAGARADEPWLARARERIRALGGAERANVMTRIYLALLGQYDWEGIPALPIGIMLMPKGTALNIYEQAYWARACIVPLLVLYYRRQVLRTPPWATIDELFVTPREQLLHRIDEHVPALSWRSFFIQADRVLKLLDRWFDPQRHSFGYRGKACRRAERWILDHQDADGAWGGIFPATAHAVMALHALGHPLESGPIARGLEAIRALEVPSGGQTRLQPCVSPVWDTAWVVIALAKAGYDRDHPAVVRATDWLYRMQILRRGDWAQKCPDVPPGGWAFQYMNDHFPDTDDSAVVLMALLNSHYRDDPRKRAAFDRGIRWLLGLQNKDGGWAAFERGADNEIYKQVLIGDGQTLLDPSTVDVTGRAVEVLGKLGYPRSHPALRRALRFLVREQEPGGAYFGRWGVNYIYGTWSALCGLAAAKVPPGAAPMRRAAAWLCSVQQPDGGFGESCLSYEKGEPTPAPACASQTAWAVMALLAAGRVSSEACRRAIAWLLENADDGGSWREEAFTGTGFPGAFYLRYRGYARYFPLLALARYREMLG